MDTNRKTTEISFDGHMIEGLVSMDVTFELDQPKILKLEILADDMTMHNTNIDSAFEQVYIVKP